MNDTILRQATFAADNPMLKGGLHCHTTRSDGEGRKARTNPIFLDGR